MSDGQTFKNISYSVQNLVTEIEIGSIALPDLQRPFVWKNKQVRDLFDSLYKGLPTGFIILWKIKHEGGYKPIGIINTSTTPDRLVIDGQQRLTSLFSVFNGTPVLNNNFKEIKPKIAFNPLTEEFNVLNSSIEKSPEWINYISEVYKGKSYHFITNFITNLKEKHPNLEFSEETISDNITKLYEIKHYTFSVLELSSNLTPEQVSEIFVRINIQGNPLNQSDVILTLMSLYWDE